MIDLADVPRIICIYDKKEYAAPIEYIFRLIMSVYGVDYEVVEYSNLDAGTYSFDTDIAITYGRMMLECDFSRHIHIYASEFWDPDYLTPDSLPETPLSEHKGIPILYTGRHDQNVWVMKGGRRYETNIDILASVFFMVSGYEKVVVDGKAFKEMFQDRPIVDEYIDMLWEWIKKVNPDIERKAYSSDGVKIKTVKR